MKRVIIDTDPGVDDTVAILLALASPELEVAVVTTIYGNGSVGMCTANARRILEAANRPDLPIFMGSAKPLLREPTPGWASHVHGSDALGGVVGEQPVEEVRPPGSKHGALAIVETAMSSPGEFTILALGRPTNVALALALEPGLAAAVREIVVVGGAVTVPGNVSGVASANLYEDPEAAVMVYQSGAPIIQVGLDVCNQVTVSPSQLETIARAGTPATDLLSAATGFLRESYERRRLLSPGEGVRYNDLPAVAYAIDPGLFAVSRAKVEVETGDENRGQTVADWNSPEPNVGVCLEVGAGAVTEMFTRRVSESFATL